MNVNYKKKVKICHITSVHSRYDSRIYQKECVSLSKRYHVILLTADGKSNETMNNVFIKSIKKQTFSLFHRVLSIPYKLYRAGMKENAEIYHLHDPELIITGLLLRIRRKKVIYDIHEDYTTSFLHRTYAFPFLTKLMSYLFDKVEKLAAVFFYKIIAEKYYEYRFPNATRILNYPISENFSFHKDTIRDDMLFSMLYTGNITKERGAVLHASILKFLDNASLTMIGYCPTEIYNMILDAVGSNQDRLKLLGLNEYISYEIIKDAYKSRMYDVGLAIFPKSRHYYRKELTKIFEYMMAGIPIICSNFPRWVELVENNRCGICVNPDNEEEIIKAIDYLKENPERRIEMGANGLKLIKQKYNWSYQEKNLFNLYERIIIK